MNAVVRYLLSNGKMNLTRAYIIGEDPALLVSMVWSIFLRVCFIVMRRSGEKTRIYSCCSRSVSDSEGCTHGPHVFYESKPEELHSRYSFSLLKNPAESSVALDIACIDCEMIYTTGGLRVARVSMVDGSGNQVFDQLVRMDDGVHVM